VETQDPGAAAALAGAAAMDEVLDAAGIGTPGLYHGDGPATWAVISEGLRRGRDVRVGLEDVLTLPDGSPAGGNAELVATVVAMARRAAR